MLKLVSWTLPELSYFTYQLLLDHMIYLEGKNKKEQLQSPDLCPDLVSQVQQLGAEPLLCPPWASGAASVRQQEVSYLCGSMWHFFLIKKRNHQSRTR